MSNRYLTLDGTKKISETYTLIPEGFDKVEQEMDTNKTTADNHIANADIHVTASKKAAWDDHIADEDIHVTPENKVNWDSKASGSLQEEVDVHIADTVAHLTSEEHQKLTGIQAGAEVNQNAFAKINEILASGKGDAVTFKAGTGITITVNPTTKEITWTATGEATPGPHGSSHDSDGSDPIPDLVELQGVVADQAADIQAASDAAGQALTAAQAAETPDGAQAKADTAKSEAISAASTDATTKANTAEANANAHSDGLVGTLSNLLTTNKSNAVAAINELFTNANSLKSDWAGVIGSPLLNTDTSAQLKSKTQTIKDTFATNLTNKGQTSTGAETLTALVAKIPNINTGKRYVKGSSTSSSGGVVSVSGLAFRPKVIIVAMDASASGSATPVGLYSEDVLNRTNNINFCVNFYNSSISSNAFAVNSNGFSFASGISSASLFNYIAYE